MTQETHEEHIVDLIKKCLALTSSPNEHEAAAAMAKAQELIEKYNLTMAQVQRDTSTGDRDPMVRRHYNLLGRFLWRKQLVITLGRHNFCRVFYTGHRDTMLIVGRETNVVAVTEMINWILPQVERLIRLAAKKHKPNKPDEFGETCSTNRYRSSFALGVINRLDKRLYEAAHERNAGNTETTALIVLRGAEVDKFVEKTMNVGTKKGAVVNRSYKGYADGNKAGDSVLLKKHLRLNGG